MPGEVDDLGAVGAPSLASRIATAATSCCPARVSTPASASRRTRGAAPDREAQRRAAGPAAAGAAGTSRLRLSATTPSVVPTPSTSSAGVDRSPTSPAAADARRRAGRPPPRRGWTAAAPAPGRRTGGAPAARRRARCRCRRARPAGRRRAGTGRPGRPRSGRRRRRAAARRSARRAARSATASGARTSSVQPSSADAVRRTCSRSRRRCPPASIGTTRLASAPPATTSKTMFGHGVRGQVGVAGAVGADGVGEDQGAAEAGEPGEQGEGRDQRRGAGDAPARAPCRGRSRRAAAEPVQFAQSRRGLDDLGEADLLAGQGQRRRCRRAGRRAAPGPGSRASRRPSRAPSALAPQSPSITRSPRSAGSTASGGAQRAGDQPARPVRRGWPRRPAATPALPARPGRRSSRLTRFAVPATRPVVSTPSTSAPAPRPRRVSSGGDGGRRADAGDLDRAGGHPPGPQRREVAGQALVPGLLGTRAGQVVVARRPAPETAPTTAAAARVPAGAPRAAVAVADAASAGPPSSVTGRPA